MDEIGNDPTRTKDIRVGPTRDERNPLRGTVHLTTLRVIWGTMLGGALSKLHFDEPRGGHTAADKCLGPTTADHPSCDAGNLTSRDLRSMTCCWDPPERSANGLLPLSWSWVGYPELPVKTVCS